MLNTLRIAVLLSVLVTFATLYAGSAQAIISQQAVTLFTDVNGVETWNSDSVDDRNAPITSTIAALITGGFGSTSLSVGPFGNLGMQGSYFQPGAYANQISIKNSDIQNNTGRAQFAQANFIIDGGFLQFFAGPGSNMEFNLSLISSITGEFPLTLFTTRIELVHDLAGVQATLFSGDDIGAAFNPLTGSVEIPLFFGSADIGIVGPNETIDLEYRLDIRGEMFQFAEIANFGFSDPLNVDGFGEAPTVTFSDVTNAVPEPAGALLLLSRLGLLAGLRRFAGAG